MLGGFHHRGIGLVLSEASIAYFFSLVFSVVNFHC